jgi:hypothetical protein
MVGGGEFQGNLFLDESSFGLKLSLYPEFQLPMCPGTGLKVPVVGGGLKPILVFSLQASFALKF